MFRHIAIKDDKMFLKGSLHGVYRYQSDEVYRANLRLILACLIARHCENDTDDASTLLMMQSMYEDGYASTTDGVWLCSYIGFERVSSKWAKAKGLRAVICARLVKSDIVGFEGESHTVQFYF